MHSFLRAIGFSKLDGERNVEKLTQMVFREYTDKEAVREDGNKAFVEYSKSVGPDMGITVCGQVDEYGFHQEYYFPYFRGNGITTKEDLVVEKHGNHESYAGICEDYRVGVSLIFYVQNPAAYKKEHILNHLLNQHLSTTFSGLSTSGKVLLPLMRINDKVQDEESIRKRTRLIAAAKNGDQEAMESLTLEDMDTYSIITRRIQQEDILSIVETFFMPYGMECDQYQILGDIRGVTKVQNSYTKEKIYQLNIDCNGMNFDVCINQADLTGEPEVGRRFKGNIWLQGRINFGD